MLVVLVHWNQPQRCAATIDAFSMQGLDVHIVVVDNGSTRAARRSLTAKIDASPHAELVSLGSNRGFGGAANVGLRHFLASDPDPVGGLGEWVAVAPHDALPMAGALARMVQLGQANPATGLVSADVGDGHIPVVDRYFGGMTRPARLSEGLEPADYAHR